MSDSLRGQCIGFCLLIYNNLWLLNFGKLKNTLASSVFRLWNLILSSGQVRDPVGTEIFSRFHREAVKKAVRFLSQFARLKGAAGSYFVCQVDKNQPIA